jgi:hypothetical protein
MVPNNTLIISHNTWIISDTHFFHENIGRYCNRPENWQELIIKNWNDLISPDENVLHLVNRNIEWKIILDSRQPRPFESNLLRSPWCNPDQGFITDRIGRSAEADLFTPSDCSIGKRVGQSSWAYS